MSTYYGISIRTQKNGYMCVSDACKTLDAGPVRLKIFYECNQMLCDWVCQKIGIRADDLFYVDGMDIYAHPFIFHHVLTWYSPKFAILTSIIMHDYSHYEITLHEDDETMKHELMLFKETEELERKRMEIKNIDLAYKRGCAETYRTMREKINVDSVSEHIEKSTSIMSIMSIMSIILLKDTSQDSDPKAIYHAIRLSDKCKSIYSNSTYRTYRKNHPNNEIIMRIEFNSYYDIWKIVKDTLKKEGKIVTSRSDCGLAGDYTEDQFKTDIIGICERSGAKVHCPS